MILSCIINTSFYKAQFGFLLAFYTKVILETCSSSIQQNKRTSSPLEHWRKCKNSLCTSTNARSFLARKKRTKSWAFEKNNSKRSPRSNTRKYKSPDIPLFILTQNYWFPYTQLILDRWKWLPWIFKTTYGNINQIYKNKLKSISSVVNLGRQTSKANNDQYLEKKRLKINVKMPSIYNKRDI